MDREGKISDRRAGRIETDLNQRLCQKIRDKVELDFAGEFFFETLKPLANTEQYWYCVVRV